MIRWFLSSDCGCVCRLAAANELQLTTVLQIKQLETAHASIQGAHDDLHVSHNEAAAERTSLKTEVTKLSTTVAALTAREESLCETLELTEAQLLAAGGLHFRSRFRSRFGLAFWLTVRRNLGQRRH